ncbi:hypothetical protein D3C72_1197530 [compost metagenome]
MRQGKAHGVVVHLVDGGYQAAELQTFKVGIAAVGDVVVRVVNVFLPHEGENHIIGVKIARRFIEFIALEFNALAQMEGVDLAVLADTPAFGQAWHQLRRAGFKIDQSVIDRYGTGIHAGARGV